MADDTKERSAPWFSFSTFRTGLEVLTQGLPEEKIDKTLFRSMDFNKRIQMVAALKFFGLIDSEGRTQDSLRALVAEPDKRKEHIRALVEERYPRIIELAKKQATEAQLIDAMRELGLKGDDPIRKGITFYRQAAEFSDLPLSSNWPGGKPGRKPGSGSATRPTRKKKVGKREEPIILPPTPLRDQNNDYSDLRDSTSGLIRALIKRGPTWNEDQAKDWVQSFLRAVRFDYPAQPTGKKADRKNTNGKKPVAEVAATVHPDDLPFE
jgi:hypothetical protein